MVGPSVVTKYIKCPAFTVSKVGMYGTCKNIISTIYLFINLLVYYPLENLGKLWETYDLQIGKFVKK